MPNHIHGIIVINKSKHISLSEIIRWYKGRLTYEIHKNNDVFSWQGRFYDHIIRKEQSLNRIRKYIMDNPANWESDVENIAGHDKIIDCDKLILEDAINRVPTGK